MRAFDCTDCLEDTEGALEIRARISGMTIAETYGGDGAKFWAAYSDFLAEEKALRLYRGTLYCQFYRASLALRAFGQELFKPLERLVVWLSKLG